MSEHSKPAPTAVPVHELIRNRWSPRAFAPRAIEPEKLRALFEAARWAASCANAQPWSFIVATKDDAANFARVLGILVELNQAWAKHAPALALSVARMNFDNGKPNRHALHDVGLAAANLALEATSLGLQVHPMAGIDPEKGKKEFEIPEGYEVVAGFAIGYPGDPAGLPDPLRQRELGARERKPASSFVFTGKWGTASPIVS